MALSIPVSFEPDEDDTLMFRANSETDKWVFRMGQAASFSPSPLSQEFRGLLTVDHYEMLMFVSGEEWVTSIIRKGDVVLFGANIVSKELGTLGMATQFPFFRCQDALQAAAQYCAKLEEEAETELDTSDDQCGVKGCICAEGCSPTSPPPHDPIDYLDEEAESERCKQLAKEVLEQLKGEPEPKKPKVVREHDRRP